MFNIADIAFSHENYPDAEVLVHPECDGEVQQLADHVLSTGGMIRHVANSSKNFSHRNRSGYGNKTPS